MKEIYLVLLIAAPLLLTGCNSDEYFSEKCIDKGGIPVTMSTGLFNETRGCLQMEIKDIIGLEDRLQQLEED